MAIDTTTSGLSSVPSGILTTAQYKAQQAATPQKTAMGQTEFLTLFTTQLKIQDPLDPVKNEAFVAQLAQFSQLEATTAMKTSMENLVSSMSNDRMLGAASLMGKQVAVPDGPVQVTNTTVSQGTINLPTGADGVQLQVFNDKGVLVRTQIGGTSARRYDFGVGRYDRWWSSCCQWFVPLCGHGQQQRTNEQAHGQYLRNRDRRQQCRHGRWIDVAGSRRWQNGQFVRCQTHR